MNEKMFKIINKMKLLKVYILMLMISGLFSTSTEAQDWANFGRYEQENSTVKPPLKKNIKVIFMGNSIFDNWRIYDNEYFTNNSYLNRGISGQVTSQMLIRFRPDVIRLQPKIVVILAGTNDIAQNQGPISIDKIAGNIFSMIELAKANNIKVVLCSTLPSNSYSWHPDIKPAEKIVKLNVMLKEYAKENKITYIDLYSLMVDKNKGMRKDLGKDTVHPNKKGYKIMGGEIDKAIKKII